MKLLTYSKNGKQQLGLLVNNNIYDLNKLDNRLPDNMKAMLANWEENFKIAKDAESKVDNGNIKADANFNEAHLLSPVPEPASCRDGYAFRQHVAAARRNRKVEMIPEFDQYPIFYFTNHQAVQGPGEVLCMPDHFQKLDFELEAAVVIGKKGRNITAAQADEYIAGYLI